MQTQCPACEAQFTWREKWRFSAWSSTPRTAPCPRCGTPLTPNREAYALMHRGSMYQAFGQLTILLNIIHFIPDYLGWVFLILAIPVIFYGSSLSWRGRQRNQFEIAGQSGN